MKLTLFLSILTISQLWATEIYSQMTKLTLKLEDVKISDALKEIENQSEFFFLYSPKLIDVEKKVHIEADKETIKDILNNIFGDKVNFAVYDRQVILTPSDLIIPNAEMEQQQIKINGIVSDKNGTPLPGVNTVITGTTQGVTTDIAGKYSIEVPRGSKTLTFTFIGFQSQEVTIGTLTQIDITMVEMATSLQEVVVIGYGTMGKKDVTGSISTFSVKDALSVSNVSVSNMIQGRASGVSISSRSAQPGGGLQIDIRGAISPNGSNKPLIVIDGVQISSQAALDINLQGPLGFSGGVDRDYLATLNPADIESITILKDASSTAIYGSAAANGVILVTTKKGKAGNVSVAYSGSYAVQNSKDYYPSLDATSFMQQVNRLRFERYLFENKKAPYYSDPYTTGFTPRFSEADIANAGAGTNWLGLLLRKGTVQEHNISITGGTEKVKTFTSINYFDNKGLLKNSSYRRYTGRFNIDYEVSSWLTLASGLSYTNTGANNASTNWNGGGPEQYTQIQLALQFPPNVPYDPTTFDIGTHSPYDPQMVNPASILTVKDYSTSSRIFATPNLEIKIIPSLKFKVQIGYDGSTFERYLYYPAAIKNTKAPNGLSNNGLNKNYNFSSEEYFTYDTKIGSSDNLNVVLGVGYYKSGYNGFSVAAQGFFTDGFGYNNIGIATDLLNTSLKSSKKENIKLSQFARFNYSISNKYIITLTARRDGASSFSEGKKYGVFPGAAVAWKVGEEHFLKGLGVVSDLKLRVSYGASGNESMVGNFPLSLYGAAYPVTIGGNSQVVNGVVMTQIGNPDLTWETDIMANFGLDFGFLNDRFTGSFDLYNKTAKNLLDYDILPYNSVVNVIASNVGSTEVNGFDFNLASKILTGKFRWTNNFNISKAKVNWKKRNPKQPLNPWIKEKDDLYAIYGWKTDGLIKTLDEIPSYMPDAMLGNVKFVDENSDGVLNEKDVVNLGSSMPTWNIGMNNTFNFKNFGLSIFVYGKFGNKRFDGYNGLYGTDNYYSWGRLGSEKIYNSCTFVEDIWTHNNVNGIHPGVADNKYSSFNPSGRNDYYLLDGAFVRLKNIMLDYQIPEGVIQRTQFIKSIRIYLDIDNIGVFTKWKGMDPEIQETNPYPNAVTTSFGVNVNF